VLIDDDRIGKECSSTRNRIMKAKTEQKTACVGITHHALTVIHTPEQSFRFTQVCVMCGEDGFEVIGDKALSGKYCDISSYKEDK
jgi:hypothetical protein